MYFSLTLYTTMAIACLWSGIRTILRLNRIAREGGRVEGKITGIVQTRNRNFYNIRYEVGGVTHNARYPVPTMGKGFQVGDKVTYCYMPGVQGEHLVEEDTSYRKGGYLMIAMGVVISALAVWNLFQIL